MTPYEINKIVVENSRLKTRQKEQNIVIRERNHTIDELRKIIVKKEKEIDTITKNIFNKAAYEKISA